VTRPGDLPTQHQQLVAQHRDLHVLLLRSRTEPDQTRTRRTTKNPIGSTKVTPVEVVTDRAAVYPRALDELARRRRGIAPSITRTIGLRADHGQLKRRLRPMRGVKTDVSAASVFWAALGPPCRATFPQVKHGAERDSNPEPPITRSLFAVRSRG
jgi:transposase-like protein